MKAFLKHNRSFCAYIIIALVLGIAAIITAPGNELLYMIFAQYLILPVAGLICSACCVKKGGILGFLSPVIFTVIASLLPFAVFKKTDIVFIIFIGVPCIIGYLLGLIGFAFSKLRKKEKEEEKTEADEFSVENDDANASESNAPEETEDEEPAVLIAD